MTDPIDPKNFDADIRPTDDFYLYANGKWLRENPIPPAESRWGSFDILAKQSREALRKIILEIAESDHEPGSNRQKIRDFYLTAMDAEKLNKEGAKPLAEEFTRIESVRTAGDLIPLFAHLQLIDAGGVWGCGVGQDAKDSESMIVHLGQGGLGLPDRDYYLKTDDKSATLRNEYKAHIAAMFILLGENRQSAENFSEKIVSIETRLAAVSMSRLERRDPEIQYNKFSVEELAERIPGIDLGTYLKEMGISHIRHLIVQQPKFLEDVSRLLKSIPIDDWKIYCRWHLINSVSPLLSDAFVEQNFAFYGRILSGKKELRPRWERAVMITDSALGEALGQEYVTRHFPPHAKQRINELVDNLLLAYRERIIALDWMAEKTKKKALEKLARIGRKLGYPNVWKDYGDLKIGTDSHVLNMLRVNYFESVRQLRKAGKPVDREEWFMTPQTVNAYFSPEMNEMAFPAAILQSPFFDPEADDAINYAGIGAVIGHEVTHGFDDEGSKYDINGNLNDWWAEEDYAKFKAKTGELAKQFSAYKVLDGVSVNGELTLGENIADLGGLSIAYDALQKALKQNGHPGPINGLSPEQRFFLNWARIWRGNISDELLRQYLTIDVHAPNKCRVIGPLSNMTAFYEAFGCKPGDAMYRKEHERIKVW